MNNSELTEEIILRRGFKIESSNNELNYVFDCGEYTMSMSAKEMHEDVRTVKNLDEFVSTLSDRNIKSFIENKSES